MPIHRYQLSGVGTTPTLITSVDSSILNETQTVWGLTVCNMVGVDVHVTMYVTDANGNTAHILKDVALPTANMFGLGEDAFNFVLMPGDKIYIYSDVASSIDVTMTTRNYL